MDKPVTLGPWQTLGAGIFFRRFHDWPDDAAHIGLTGWKVWPPSPGDPVAEGTERGEAAKPLADAAARALGWVLLDAEPTESTLDDLAGEDPPKCPSCEVPYIEHPGLHGTCAALLAMTKERDELRAKLADVDAAIERNARIRRAEWTDDDCLFVADFTSEAARFLADMLLARLDLENAPNYAECSIEDLGRLHVALTGLQIDMCFRRAGAPTPHELRVKAEKERDAALALAEERRVRLMLVGEDPAPGGWRYFTVKALNGEVRQGLRWVHEDFALRVDNHGAVRASDFETSRRVLHPSATEAWKHAQALRSFIAEHGVLPKETT